MNYDILHTRLIEWYEVYHRILPWRETEDPYKIWVSEIILQQTRVTQGMAYYLRFVERFDTIVSLASAREDEVLRLWQGLGYYSRARNMHRAAQMIVASGKGFPKTMDELCQLPGIGDYTAGAILSFAYDMPYPAMDGNVYRVLARLFDADRVFDTSAGKKYFHHIANEVLDRDHPRLFNSALMEFGALYCTPQLDERCERCTLQALCMGFAHHTAELLPIRKPRAALKDRYLQYTIYLTPDKHTLIRQRLDNDIWKHLYEFPLEETASEPSTPPDSTHLLWKGIHVLSHQRLHVTFYITTVKQLPLIDGTISIAWDDLDNYALSQLSLKAIQRMG